MYQAVHSSEVASLSKKPKKKKRARRKKEGKDEEGEKDKQWVGKLWLAHKLLDGNQEILSFQHNIKEELSIRHNISFSETWCPIVGIKVGWNRRFWQLALLWFGSKFLHTSSQLGSMSSEHALSKDNQSSTSKLWTWDVCHQSVSWILILFVAQSYVLTPEVINDAAKGYDAIKQEPFVGNSQPFALLWILTWRGKRSENTTHKLKPSKAYVLSPLHSDANSIIIKCNTHYVWRKQKDTSEDVKHIR